MKFLGLVFKISPILFSQLRNFGEIKVVVLVEVVDVVEAENAEVPIGNRRNQAKKVTMKRKRQLKRGSKKGNQRQRR